ncbi:MAG: cytochrome-c oxidase, cbb3-type subunit III [Alcanivoracaceae bacterium]|nr:cytochrome-c oxidase, cbb3-type subunit III [Alcanivoracaceae bacterium]
MSDFWSWYVIVIVALNIGGCAVLLWANRKMSASEAAKETTGHNFDGIEERNTPLPRWWLILFWLTLGFAIVYLVLYPGMGNYEGTLGWSSHKQWQEEVELVEARTAPLFAQYAAEPVEELIKYDEVMGVGARLFANNCAVCHGADARGARGYPNLTDDDWLYGGSPDAIKQTLVNGRQGMMPPMAAAIGGTDEAVSDMALYVASLSRPQLADDPAKAEAIARAKPKFAMCAACHGADGTGNQMMGAPNLTDNTWLYGNTLKDIEYAIRNGRAGKMPAQQDLLSPEQIHVLTAYVYGLSRNADNADGE